MLGILFTAFIVWVITGFIGNLVVCRRHEIRGVDLMFLSALSLVIGPFVLFALGED